MCDRDERRHNPLARAMAGFASGSAASSSESESESDDSACDFAGEEHRARIVLQRNVFEHRALPPTAAAAVDENGYPLAGAPASG